MPNEGVRGYIRTLREARLQADTNRPSIYSQRRFGAAIGLSERAYIDWETGETKTLKTGPLLKAGDPGGAVGRRREAR
jgi:DNA-binding XRE family transcriptional regulator